MGYEITRSVTVGANGHIEADLPELREGQTVELIVRTERNVAYTKRGLVGCLRGELLYMSEDFDDSLTDFFGHQ